MQAADVSLQQVADLLVHKRTHFALWRPAVTDPAPKLVIGSCVPGDPPTFAQAHTFPLSPSAKGPDLWDIAAKDCLLENGKVYHYWFEVTDSNLYKESH